MRRVFLAVILLTAIAACSGGSTNGQVAPTAYPTFCNCTCMRCIERDPATAACLRTGVQSFSPATCTTAENAEAACATTCGQFGWDCTVTVGNQASETPCTP